MVCRGWCERWKSGASVSRTAMAVSTRVAPVRSKVVTRRRAGFPACCTSATSSFMVPTCTIGWPGMASDTVNSVVPGRIPAVASRSPGTTSCAAALGAPSARSAAAASGASCFAM
jgi:hypothetical protein